METDKISDAQLLDPNLRRRPPHTFQQTPQMGQTLYESQTARQEDELDMLYTFAESSRVCFRQVCVGEAG